VPAQQLTLETARYPGLDSISRCVDIAEGTDGRLWFAFPDRLQCLDGDTVHEVPFAADEQGLGPTGLRCLDATPDGTLWIGAVRGLWRLPPGTTEAVPIPALSGTSVWRVRGTPDGGAALLTQRQLLRLWPDQHTAPIPPPAEGMLGLLTTNFGLWTWTRAGAFCLPWENESGSWQSSATDLPGDIQAACSDGQAVFVITPAQIWRCREQQPAAVLAADLSLDTPRHATVTPQGLWLASPGKLWEFTWRTGHTRLVQLISSGSDAHNTLTAMHRDRHGLLWTGWQQGVTRTKRQPSIDNVLLDALSTDDAVTALAEDDEGDLFLGTARGRVLRTGDAGAWRVLTPPWATAKNSAAAVVGIATEPGGALVVATQNSGVWRQGAGTWTPVALGENPGQCRSLLRTGDELWIATDTKVLIFSADDPNGVEVSLPLSATGQPAGPGAFVPTAGGAPWLATYRAGVLRFDRRTLQFRGHGLEWPEDAVLGGVDHPTAGLWAISADGLWQIDRGTGVRALRQPTARGTGFHTLMAGTAGNLWLTTNSQLACFDPELSRAVLLSPRTGAHPFGYGWRNGLARRNGEVWFGARRGYTCIRPTTAGDLAAPLQIDAVALAADGAQQALPQADGTWHLPPGTRACTVTLRLGDHTEDTAPKCTLLLRSPDGTEAARSTSPVLAVPWPGRYALVASAVGPTGTSQDLHLGWVVATATTSPWWPATAIGLLGLLASSLAWWYGRGRRRNHRQRQVESILAAAERPPEQILDLAFLAAAAGEECAEITGARHTSVWLHEPERSRRVLLAEFGARCPDAEARLARCCTSGRTFQDLGWSVDSPQGMDLTLCLNGAGPLEFELFLAPVAALALQAPEQLRRAMAPLQAGLRKQAWIQRLESNFAHNSAHLHASLHDLRGSLTSLRLSAFLLTKEPQPTPDFAKTAQSVASAAEQVAARLDGLMADFEHTRGVDLKPADPCPVVRHVVQALVAQAAAKQIDLDLVLPQEGPPIPFDAHWLPRVVDNLLGNAIKYSAPGSTVRVAGSFQDGGFLLHVDDSGPGFARSELDSVFLPGVVGTAKPTGNERQQGLGLWIARQATRAMGGRLWVATTSAKGSRLSLWLPSTEAPTAEPAERTPDP
jgi:signal transduction histidine kinase/ligand-binding sensor domain-containing protein